MARSATTSDVFNAIGDRCRRDILITLGAGEHDVTALVERLRSAQPQISQPLVSKHLKVLREVDLVRCRHTGKRRFYRVNAEALRPVHVFTARFEQMWNERLDRLDDVLLGMQEHAEHPAGTHSPDTNTANESGAS